MTARIENNNAKTTAPPVEKTVKPPKDTSNPEREANRAARQARQQGRQTRRKTISDTRQRNAEELNKLRGFMNGGAYSEGGSYGNNDLYREGGTYYLNGGQIAKLRALGYDIQEH
jgi:hypothetical protein